MHARSRLFLSFAALVVWMSPALGSVIASQPPDRSEVADSPSLVSMSVTRAFVPEGFDSNDRAQAMVMGTFPDACYRTAPIHANVDRTRKILTIRAGAYYYFGNCPRITVPFTQVVEFGVLDTGTYRIVDGRSGKELGQLDVKAATRPEADDYLYLPVDDAYVRHDAATNTNRLVVVGMVGTQCTKIKEMRISYTDDVIIVQPITEVQDHCAPSSEPPTAEVELKHPLHGLYLLHVRSLNGQAVNKLVHFP